MTSPFLFIFGMGVCEIEVGRKEAFWRYAAADCAVSDPSTWRAICLMSIVPFRMSGAGKVRRHSELSLYSRACLCAQSRRRWVPIISRQLRLLTPPIVFLQSGAQDARGASPATATDSSRPAL